MRVFHFDGSGKKNGPLPFFSESSYCTYAVHQRTQVYDSYKYPPARVPSYSVFVLFVFCKVFHGVAPNGGSVSVLVESYGAEHCGFSEKNKIIIIIYNPRTVCWGAALGFSL